MRRSVRLITLLVLGAVALFAVGPEATQVAPRPEVSTVSEVPDEHGRTRWLVLHGERLTKLREATLYSSTGSRHEPFILLHKSNVAILHLRDELPRDVYTLALAFRKKTTQELKLHITNGLVPQGSISREELTDDLQVDIDDASKLGGQNPSYYTAASNLTGKLPQSAFSAYDNLKSESKLGTGSSHVARGDHDHAGAYWSKGDKIQWSAITGIPSGFGDGIDDVADTIDWKDVTNKPAGFSDDTDDVASSIGWDSVTGKPAGFADGEDDGDYSIGDGLRHDSAKHELLVDWSSVSRAGHGHDSTYAKLAHHHNSLYAPRTHDHAGVYSLIGHHHDTRYALTSHNHDSRYVAKSGGTFTGKVTFNNEVNVSTSGTGFWVKSTATNPGNNVIAGSAAGQATGVTGVSPSGYGVWGRSTSKTGVFGETISSTGTIYGVHGKTGSSDGQGVFGEATYAGTGGVPFGVHGKTYGSTGVGVYGHNTSSGEGVIGKSTSGIGVKALSSGSAAALHGETSGTGSAVEVDHKGTSGNLAVFRRNGSRKVRFDLNGRGYFNGGTQTGGADFAESVAVNRPKSEFAPGDVMVVDGSSDRTFALSTEPESTLVAGVYSTKPGILATKNDVAAGGSWRDVEVPLAVVGIVPVKVCDEGGPVRRGDLLVTASVPGHAKKAPMNPRPGTLLGKSLGELEQGRGVIEALITLN